MWLSLDLTNKKSVLVHVMAWCHLAASHYLGQCWPRSMSPYGVTRPQWVKDYKTYIHILNRIFDLAWVWPKEIKLTLEQQCVLSALHCHYHTCWCTGDLSHQCINRYGIDPQSWNIQSPALEELILRYISPSCFHFLRQNGPERCFSRPGCGML